jgi:hypothetical protein
LRPLTLKEDQVIIFQISEDDEERLDLVDSEDLAKKVLEVYQDNIKEDNPVEIIDKKEDGEPDKNDK